MKSSSAGQAALILIMIMAVIGAVSVSVAAREVESLRSQEIETAGSQAESAASAGIEVALSTRANVPQTPVGTGDVTYQATYASLGSTGFVAGEVEEGDVVSVSFTGAAGVTAVNVYWNNTAAIFASLLNANTVSGNYTVDRYSGDADATRVASNNFTQVTSGSYTFQGVSFQNQLVIPINLSADPAPTLLRILVLYATSLIGVEPVGGTLADGQVVTVNSTGTAENNIVTNVSLTRFSERIPAVFDNVLYTNSSLSQ
ncbi:MAG: hypothetical protein WAV56_04185 [Microgenomates group bacterium]